MFGLTNQLTGMRVVPTAFLNFTHTNIKNLKSSE
jgi:hypothetical protein